VLETLLCFLVALRVFLRSRSDTALEVLALRQQIAVLKRKQPRPRLNSWDQVFWTTLLPLDRRPGPGETRYRSRLAPRRFRGSLFESAHIRNIDPRSETMVRAWRQDGQRPGSKEGAIPPACHTTARVAVPPPAMI
jgi:hypothetical protein